MFEFITQLTIYCYKNRIYFNEFCIKTYFQVKLDLSLGTFLNFYRMTYFKKN